MCARSAISVYSTRFAQSGRYFALTFVVAADDPALQKRPETLNRLSVHARTYSHLEMGYVFVRQILFETAIVMRFIGCHQAHAI